LGYAAIDVKLSPRDIAGLVGREERNSFSDLVGISQPAERNDDELTDSETLIASILMLLTIT
jgi:hypothetical protein